MLHNPRSDRRTTKGVFHVVENGLPIPSDKKNVPSVTFARLLKHALNPPRFSGVAVLELTAGKSTVVRFSATQANGCPGIPGIVEERSLETRFFVPGSLVANLDFVESILEMQVIRILRRMMQRWIHFIGPGIQVASFLPLTW